MRTVISTAHTDSFSVAVVVCKCNLVEEVNFALFVRSCLVRFFFSVLLVSTMIEFVGVMTNLI